MDDLLSTVSSKLVSLLNPTLLANPPPVVEETNGNDICYQNPTIYCKELHFGMRGVVGSWFLSPLRIISETAVVVSVASLIIFYLGVGGTSTSKSGDRNNKTAKLPSLRPPKIMRIVTTITFTLQLAYKVCGYPGKILVMVMPCNMLWILNMILCYFNYKNDCIGANKTTYSYDRISHTILQLQCSYVGLVLVALANPDFSDTVLYGEVYFFYLHHFFLLYYILHYVFITRKVSTYIPSEKDDQNVRHDRENSKRSGLVDGIKVSTKWVLLSCAYFAFFYFGVVTPMSILSGLNLNYMLHPPPNQDDLVGQGYRIMSIVYCAVLFTVMRLVMVMSEFSWRKIIRLTSGGNSHAMTNKNT